MSEKLLKILKIKVDYEIIEKGVWSSSTTLRFSSLGNGDASIDENGEDIIETMRIDEALGDTVPTFIKMDVEGQNWRL